jgi:hypothetical protein
VAAPAEPGSAAWACALRTGQPAGQSRQRPRRRSPAVPLQPEAGRLREDLLAGGSPGRPVAQQTAAPAPQGAPGAQARPGTPGPRRPGAPGPAAASPRSAAPAAGPSSPCPPAPRCSAGCPGPPAAPGFAPPPPSSTAGRPQRGSRASYY